MSPYVPESSGPEPWPYVSKNDVLVWPKILTSSPEVNFPVTYFFPFPNPGKTLSTGPGPSNKLEGVRDAIVPLESKVYDHEQ